MSGTIEMLEKIPTIEDIAVYPDFIVGEYVNFNFRPYYGWVADIDYDPGPNYVSNWLVWVEYFTNGGKLSRVGLRDCQITREEISQ
jgi:hypothetical protein